MPFGAALARAWADRRGSIGVVLAAFMMVSVSLCALAIDAGALYLERRTVQGAADLAALAAASDLDHAESAAQATLSANGFGDVQSMVLVKGRYEGDPAVLRANRFEAGKKPYNAVRLDVGLKGQLYFAKSFMSEPDISVSALGTTDAQATFSIGSRLASVHGGLANAVLGALLGGSVNLSAMDYQALLNANVSLGQFLSAMATEIGITAGSFDDVWSSDVTLGQLLQAAATASAASGNAQAAQALDSLLGQANSSAELPMKSLVDLGPLSNAEIGQSHAGLGGEVNVMSLITAAASLANGGNQVAVNLGATVPGLLSLTLDLAIGEAAQHSGWVAVGQAGATVRTAQTRLRLVAEIGGSGALAGVRIRLPLYIELASAEARLKVLTCRTPPVGNPEAVIEARPAVVRAWIGDVAPGGLSSFGTSVPVSAATLVHTPLLTVSASAYAEMTNDAATDLRFTQSDVDGHVIRTAEVHDYVSSLVGSLLQSATLNVNIAGLGIGLGAPAVKTLLRTILTPVATTLDGLLVPLLEMVGVHVGEVDVQVNGFRCGGAVLAG